ncbi:hypothetical protein M427DRAFT_109045 [Gonapodya prolifera JEL478]|uniref:phenylalanine 4-monooxygenase n=1 Tax=Gonapodya prolifera (strain JEL478) TaxID=1344416 RepID=A0A139AR14_GONPJ|nr:hypothetical protein M427DRAFT_109045 [Gonapodya prolifera JEL478]|eukprot:KXS19197.1 hypothetical protein M427DRAFT_109045 [Gonapodya prolifera JEL478]
MHPVLSRVSHRLTPAKTRLLLSTNTIGRFYTTPAKKYGAYILPHIPHKHSTINNHAATTLRPFASASDPTKDIQGSQNTTIYFTIVDRVGALEEVLGRLAELDVSLTSIESRPGRHAGLYDFYIDFLASEDKQVAHAVTKLAKHVKEIRVVSTGGGSTPGDLVEQRQSAWFPRRKQDLDLFAERVLSYGAELDSDHPGFTDDTYRARRAAITKLAREYRTGMPLARIVYTAEEIATWGQVYQKLEELHFDKACREYQYIKPLLVANCGYGPDNIPQLEDISRFLKECTGFTLRPVMGLLSSRDFLNALAFRVFFSTQYIRHSSNPFYTPEPDVCHELLGHVPLFADPDFADFSQEIGLASLGASEEDIKKLATIYWFTVEFGLCKQGNGVKAFGAGLLSSFGELDYCLSDKPQRVRFDPEKAAVQDYPITEYQPIYFVADSFKVMKEQVRSYANRLSRPFSLRYNAYTETIEVLDEKERLIRMANNIRGDLSRLAEAIEYI